MNYKTSDSIFANITSIYGSSVIVVRLSGTFQMLLKALIGLEVNIEKLKDKSCFLAKLKSNNEFLDEALITYFKAPHSFTGEDVIEIAIHGSRFIFEALSKSLINSGLRFALNGEFSYRAFLNGKTDLVMAEGMANLIASETELQHKIASRRFNGKDSKIFEELKILVLEVLANIESLIDFSDEDLPKSIASELEEKVQTIKIKIKSYLLNNSAAKLNEGLKLAIIGRPNVGKSSIFNMLCGREKSIVSKLAGTTRDIIEEKIIVKGVPIIFYDTAGIRNEGSDEVEMEGIKRALSLLENTDIKLLVSETEDFKKIATEFNIEIDENTILIQNKIDTTSIRIKGAIHLSTTNCIGLHDLLSEIEKKIETNFLPLLNTALFVNERERLLLENAYEFLSMFNLNKEIELASEDLRCAANAIGAIIGRIDIEDILGNIFSKFCIGK